MLIILLNNSCSTKADEVTRLRTNNPQTQADDRSPKDAEANNNHVEQPARKNVERDGDRGSKNLSLPEINISDDKAQEVQTAFRSNNEEQIKQFLNDNPNFNQMVWDKMPILIWAISNQWKIAVKAMLEVGADPNVCYSYEKGLTQPALFYSFNSDEIFQMMLENRDTNINILDGWGFTALMDLTQKKKRLNHKLYLSRGNTLIKKMQKNKIDQQATTDRKTALMMATLEERSDSLPGLVETLIEAGADLDNLKNEDDQTSRDMVQAMLEYQKNLVKKHIKSKKETVRKKGEQLQERVNKIEKLIAARRQPD